MDISSIVTFALDFFDVPLIYVFYWVAAYLVISIVALDVTMVQFLAVMRIRAMRDAGIIHPRKTPVLWWYSWLVVVRGILCDLWVQIFVCTPIGLELPPLKLRIYHGKNAWVRVPYYTIEWLTTHRLQRWDREPAKTWWDANIKKRMVSFGKLMLDPSDTTGKHI